jgi:hypothetical protein
MTGSSKWAVEFMNAETDAIHRRPTTESPGFVTARFRLETAQMVLPSIISAKLLESEARLLRAQKADAFKSVPSPTDLGVGQPLGDVAEKILHADTLRFDGDDEKYLKLLVEAQLAPMPVQLRSM